MQPVLILKLTSRDPGINPGTHIWAPQASLTVPDLCHPLTVLPGVLESFSGTFFVCDGPRGLQTGNPKRPP